MLNMAEKRRIAGAESRLSSGVTFLRLFASQNKTALLHLVLFIAVWKTFVPCISNGFSNYDDHEYVYANDHVTSGLTWENLLWSFSSSTVCNWHPLTMLTHIVDWQVFGARAWGHHLLNVVLHCLNSVLAFRLINKLTGLLWTSFWVALFFGIHPLRVESVAWISERKDVLSTFFFILTALAYANYVLEARTRNRNSKRQYYLALLWLFLGLMSKPMLVTVPFLLILLDFWPLGRWKNEGLFRLVKEKMPFLLLTAAFSVLTCFTQKGALYPLWAMPLHIRLENVVVSYCRYLAKLFWPVELACLYPYPTHWPAGYVAACGIFLLLTTAFVTVVRRHAPFALVGWLWFVGTLVPVIGIVQVGTQSMADRYSYIPSLGVLVVLVWCSSNVVSGWRFGSASLAVVAVCLSIASSALTRRQISYWRDGITLWRRAAAVTDLNYSAATIIGLWELEAGNYDAAITNLQYAIKLKGSLSKARIGLGRALWKKGRVDDAIKTLKISTAIEQTNAFAHKELGLAWLAKGCTNEAISHLAYALSLCADVPEAAQQLARLTNLVPSVHPAFASTNGAAAEEKTSAK